MIPLETATLQKDAMEIEEVEENTISEEEEEKERMEKLEKHETLEARLKRIQDHRKYIDRLNANHEDPETKEMIKIYSETPQIAEKYKNRMDKLPKIWYRSKMRWLDAMEKKVKEEMET